MGWTSSLMGVGSLVLIVAGHGPSLATVIPCWRCSTAYCGPTARRSRTIRMSHVSNKRLQQQRRVMSAAAEGSGDSYKWAMWKGRARRAMKYVSMPIVSIPGQPREQLMIALPFPGTNKTVNFVLDTLRRTTLVTPTTRDALGVGEDADGHEQMDFGQYVELPAARIGKEPGDHFMVLLDALVANPEQVKALGPNTGGVLGLEFCNTYDLDLNFERKEVRVYAAGSVDQGMIDTSGLEELSCAFLPGGKLGIKMELNGGGPFTAVLDLASNSTAGNWAAARDLDVTAIAKGQSSSYPPETGRSRPLMCAQFDTIQLGHVLLTSVPEAKTAKEGRLAVYVGYLPEFQWISEDISSAPQARQLALVGQDLMAHRRLVVSCRSKRLFFVPREVNDIWAGQLV